MVLCNIAELLQILMVHTECRELLVEVPCHHLPFELEQSAQAHCGGGAGQHAFGDFIIDKLARSASVHHGLHDPYPHLDVICLGDDDAEVGHGTKQLCML
jgi:hypothetical protein